MNENQYRASQLILFAIGFSIGETFWWKVGIGICLLFSLYLITDHTEFDWDKDLIAEKPKRKTTPKKTKKRSPAKKGQ